MDANELATQITDKIFTNGAGDQAKRLVLELENGRNGGGWSKSAMRDFIRDILIAHKVTINGQISRG